MAQYVPPRKAQQVVGVASVTLKEWALAGHIPFITTPGGKRLYDISKFSQSRSQNANSQSNLRQKVCYCRVSSTGQRDDLERQIQAMRSQFPHHKIISDIGSGINFKRKGLLQLLELCQRQLIDEVVIAYRDRLCRFAFELFEWLFQQNGVKLLVLNSQLGSEQSELAEDLMSIIHVFNCRVQGKRKYKKNSKESPKQEKEGSK
ncbi:MAG: IS607 family transposase [Bacteroidota bacterium]